MINQPTPGSPATVHPRAQTLPAQALVNRMMRGLLRAPLLSRLVGRRLVTLYVVGRKSGRRYTVPVAYTPDQGDLLIGTPFGWGRNLRTGEPVTIRFRGRRRVADVRVRRDMGEICKTDERDVGRDAVAQAALRVELPADVARLASGTQRLLASGARLRQHGPQQEARGRTRHRRCREYWHVPKNRG